MISLFLFITVWFILDTFDKNPSWITLAWSMVSWDYFLFFDGRYIKLLHHYDGPVECRCKFSDGTYSSTIYFIASYRVIFSVLNIISFFLDFVLTILLINWISLCFYPRYFEHLLASMLRAIVTTHKLCATPAAKNNLGTIFTEVFVFWCVQKFIQILVISFILN